MTRSFAGLRRSFVFCGLVTACSTPAGEARVSIDTAAGDGKAGVLVHGFSPRDSVRVRVSVSGESSPIVGRFAAADSGLRFQPAFPFDGGREYEVRIGGAVATRFRLPASTTTPSTRVVKIFPDIDTLPENQLRLYVEFSAPMSRDGGLPYVHLLDAHGREVKAAFLPLDADFWNRERTRYTLFLDPGRVKRGILPNEQMGRALISGRRYSIVIDSTWRDGNGLPLVSSYTRRFVAGPADFKPIMITTWQVQPARARTRDTLVVRFNEALDHGLIQRAIGVERAPGELLDGDVRMSAGDDTWRFVPTRVWSVGNHRVVILDILEDLAGNRVNRAFEVDLFQRADTSAAPSRFTIPFRVR